MKNTFNSTPFLLLLTLLMVNCQSEQNQQTFKINDEGYYDVPGLNVMAFQDFYPDGHQGGITVIQNGIRVLANGDVRLEDAPGQWSPIPKKGQRVVDPDNNEIRTTLWYPDSSRNGTGFNPIKYPDLTYKYQVRIRPEGNAFHIYVDLEKPLPDEWYGKVGFNIELFPGFYFEKGYVMDDQTGIFPRQANGPGNNSREGGFRLEPLAVGEKLIIVPENDDEKIVFTANGNDIRLIDGRGRHNNGFFIVRTLLIKGKTKNAAELIVTPSYKKDWKYTPVIHVSQVGYHPGQRKVAVIELDKNDRDPGEITLWKVAKGGGATNYMFLVLAAQYLLK